MLTRTQLKELHGTKLPLHVLEQDYIQSLFLQELYRRTDALVFKGGTYMKHAFGLDRFSEDLDFTMSRTCDVLSLLRETASSMDRYAVASTLERTVEGPVSIDAVLRYMGPLFNGSDRSRGTVRIEVSRRRDIFTTPEWNRLFFEYPESPVVNVRGLSKVEVMAEKLRALGTRSKGRDLYDVWFLLNKGTATDKDLFERKMEVMDRDPVIDIVITEREYTNDLSTLLIRPPGYSVVVKMVKDELKRNGFKVSWTH